VARKLQDPVDGQAQVVFCPAPSRDEHGGAATFSRLPMFLVLHAPGVPARPVRVSKTVRSAKHPRPGEVIPAVIDRSDPDRFEIRWKERPMSSLADLVGGGPLGEIPPDLAAQARAAMAGQPEAPEPMPEQTSAEEIPADALQRLAALHQRGALTDDELEAERRRFAGA